MVSDEILKHAALELYNDAYFRVGNSAYNDASTRAKIDHNLPDNIQPVMGVMAQDVVLDSLKQLLIPGGNECFQSQPLLPAWQSWYDAMIREAKVLLWIMAG